MLTFVLFAIVIVLLYVVIRQRLTIIGLRKQQTHLVYLIEAAKTYGRYVATEYFHEYAKWLDDAPGFMAEWHRYVAKSKKAYMSLASKAQSDFDRDAIVQDWYNNTKAPVIPGNKESENVS